MKHLIEPTDMTPQEVDEVLNLADRIIANPKAYAHKCEGKKLATLFYEPSTRTRLSFEAAMLELGGSVLGFSSANSSSAAKGESVADTIRTVECYADIAAMRHPKEGAAKVAAMNATTIKVINAGDGGHLDGQAHRGEGRNKAGLCRGRSQLRPARPGAGRAP